MDTSSQDLGKRLLVADYAVASRVGRTVVFRAGRRGMGLPDALVALLRRHRIRQDHDRAAACELWSETGYVFTTPTGQPLHPRSDYSAWKRLLEQAKVPERRLHDARHTAATVLLLLGVPLPAVMGIMGWSSAMMATRYQHIVDAVRRDVAVDGLLWGPPAGLDAPES
jgi:integrase